MTTTVVGQRPDGTPYIVTLPALPRGLTPPAVGAEVVGPDGQRLAWDPTDSAAVMLWLRARTSVVRVDGPDPTPPPESDPGVVY